MERFSAVRVQIRGIVMRESQISYASMFVDANVWLYAIIDTQDPEKARIAKQIISTTPGLVVSTQTINEVCV